MSSDSETDDSLSVAKNLEGSEDFAQGLVGYRKKKLAAMGG